MQKTAIKAYQAASGPITSFENSHFSLMTPERVCEARAMGAWVRHWGDGRH